MTYATALTTPARTARRSLLSALLCACMALCVFSAAPDAHAARKKTTQAEGSTAQKKGSVKIKQHRRRTSEETTAERDRRMYRECWGRPNAGACLGYTRR